MAGWEWSHATLAAEQIILIKMQQIRVSRRIVSTISRSYGRTDGNTKHKACQKKTIVCAYLRLIVVRIPRRPSVSTVSVRIKGRCCRVVCKVIHHRYGESMTAVYSKRRIDVSDDSVREINKQVPPVLIALTWSLVTEGASLIFVLASG